MNNNATLHLSEKNGATQTLQKTKKARMKKKDALTEEKKTQRNNKNKISTMQISIKRKYVLRKVCSYHRGKQNQQIGGQIMQKKQYK